MVTVRQLYASEVFTLITETIVLITAMIDDEKSLNNITTLLKTFQDLKFRYLMKL